MSEEIYAPFERWLKAWFGDQVFFFFYFFYIFFYFFFVVAVVVEINMKE